MSSHTAHQPAPRGRRPRRGPRSGSASGSGRGTSHFTPHPTTRAVTRPQADYDPRPVGFDTLGLEGSLIEGVRIRGFSATTPIQSAVIPIVMDGDDLIGCADTGTGKTAAFLLPILNRMLRAREAAPEERGFTRVLILAPTRELAVQIEDDVQGFIYHTDITSIAVYGGVDMGPQERALKSGVDIVVATPGRLMDHMRSKTVAFDKLDTLVLDEADRMMDMGFWPDVRRIVQTLPDSAARQTLLFSATMPEEVMKLADEVVREAKYVQVGSAGGPAKSITHTIESVASSEKTEWLAKFLRRTAGPVLVFMRTKSGAERLARKLSSLGLKAAALHADRTQAQRSQAIEGFRSGSYRVLVATDVAARGLDVERISHVLNYDIPHDPESYVHRIGRTGRAGRSGSAILFVSPRERHLLKSIEKVSRSKVIPADLPTVEDVNAQRVAKFRDSITDALDKPGIDLFRSLIQDYERENDVPMADIAAALAAQLRDGEEFLMTEPPPEKRRPRDRDARPPGKDRLDRKPREGLATYRISVGKRHKVGPGHIVGAIANEGGLHRSDFGHITIRPDFSLVELPAKLPGKTLKALENTRISGVKINLQPDRAPDKHRRKQQ